MPKSKFSSFNKSLQWINHYGVNCAYRLETTAVPGLFFCGAYISEAISGCYTTNLCPLLKLPTNYARLSRNLVVTPPKRCIDIFNPILGLYPLGISLRLF